MQGGAAHAHVTPATVKASCLPQIHPVILRNVIRDYFADPALTNTPLIFSEYGRSSAAPYSLTSQADVIGLETATLAAFASNTSFPLFLGAFAFVFSDSNLEGEPGWWGGSSGPTPPTSKHT